MKRPKKLGAGLVALLAHVEPELRERVREEAGRLGVTVSAVISGYCNAGLVAAEERRERKAARARSGASVGEARLANGRVVRGVRPLGGAGYG